MDTLEGHGLQIATDVVIDKAYLERTGVDWGRLMLTISEYAKATMETVIAIRLNLHNNATWALFKLGTGMPNVGANCERGIAALRCVLAGGSAPSGEASGPARYG